MESPNKKIKLEKVPEPFEPQKVAKILFLMVDGSRAQEEYAKMKELKLTDFNGYPWAKQLEDLLGIFKTALMDGTLKGIQKKFKFIKEGLQAYKQPSTNPRSLQKNIEEVATFDRLKKEEEDILKFVEAMEIVGCKAPRKVEKFMHSITTINRIPIMSDKGEQSPKKMFFLCAENKLHLKIAEQLTDDEVRKLWSRVREIVSKKDMFDLNEYNFEFVPGIKEIAYFYLILKMIKLEKMNKIYTHHLIKAINEIQDECNKEKVSKITTSLKQYPMGSHPPGLCLIFSMTVDRSGAIHDAEQVESFFGNDLKYDVSLRYNPTKEIFQSIMRELSSSRYMYYDSLVVWFMAHGNENSIQFCDDIMNRKEIINEIMKLKCFEKKPKIIFLQACETKVESSETQGGNTGMETGADSMDITRRTFEQRYGEYRNLVTCNRSADTLVAHATSWWEKASRNDDGSLFVNTVIEELEKHGTSKIIETVLRGVHYKVNQIQLETGNRRWKQTPYIESTLQKEFIFSSAAQLQD